MIVSNHRLSPNAGGIYRYKFMSFCNVRKEKRWFVSRVILMSRKIRWLTNPSSHVHLRDPKLFRSRLNSFQAFWFSVSIQMPIMSSLNRFMKRRFDLYFVNRVCVYSRAT
jgi:hypothetical protein